MKILLVDVGSTNIKYRLCTERGEALSQGSVPFPPPCLDDGIKFEVPLGEIFGTVGRILAENEADELFLSVQMHGFILADEAMRPLTEYVSWRDRRSIKIFPSAEIPKSSGESAKPNLPFLSLGAIAGEQPGLYKRAAHFFTLGSRLAYWLTGRNASHITDAAASGFYDVRTGERRNSPYSVCLPEAAREVRALGEYRGMRVFTPCGDQQCAVFGADAESDEYVLNLGTAAQLCTVADGYLEGDFESRPYFGGGTLCTVTGLIGGGEMSRFTGDERALENLLYDNYEGARERLPKRGGLLITGGVVGYRRETLCRVAERMKLPYRFHEGADALEGLYKLSEVQRG